MVQSSHWKQGPCSLPLPIWLDVVLAAQDWQSDKRRADERRLVSHCQTTRSSMSLRNGRNMYRKVQAGRSRCLHNLECSRLISGHSGSAGASALGRTDNEVERTTMLGAFACLYLLSITSCHYCAEMLVMSPAYRISYLGAAQQPGAKP